MKKWLTIPMGLIAAILPSCGRENDNDAIKDDKKPISKKIEEKDRLSIISRDKDPSDCGFSNSHNK